MGLSLEQQNGVWGVIPVHRRGIYDYIFAAVHAVETTERLRAVEVLGKSDDPRAVRPLADLLGDSDPAVRLAAVAALGHLKSGRPVDDLIGRLRDRSEPAEIRRQAVVTLAAIRSTGAIRGLRDFAADADEDPALRTLAENLLRELGTW
jgi:HEAT repeat protein